MTVPLDAVCQVTAWKSPELQKYCCALVKTGLGMLAQEIHFFGCDDLPDEDQPNSPSVSGISCRVLKAASLIVEYGGHHTEQGVFHGRRKSRHLAAHGREIHLYQITSVEMCLEFLKRNNSLFEPQQTSLF